MPRSSIFSSEYSRGPLYQYWKERSTEEKATREQRIEEARLRARGFQPLSPASGPSSHDSYVRRATSGPPGYIAATNGGGSGSSPGEGDGDVIDEGILPASSANPLLATIRGTSIRAAEADFLPSYDAATSISIAATAASSSSASNAVPVPRSSNDQNPPPPQDPDQDGRLLNATEEKARLAHLDSQRREIERDATLARTLSSPASVLPPAPSASITPSTSTSAAALDGDADVGSRYASIVNDTSDEPEPVPASRRKKSTAGKVGRWLADAATGYTKRQERF
ncbi:hypothetical protein LTR84_011186 [Exophiala bonariae]|uniref:Uncharacterized protein n=1 Tax=Exophiala bonariae TaxID=1690606 RepID=A0AAV9NIE8_9EURO|nr:hypothetical protein LTR84_011186 [Exophiala bonariae]